MNRDIQVRKPGEADVPAVLTLLRQCLGKGEMPWSTERWRWKHCQSPFGPSAVRVAVADGEIVGVRVFMRWTLVTEAGEVPCARAVDTATRPDWRRRGVFSELTRSILHELDESKVSLSFNTSNEQSGPANLTLGWSEVGRIPFAIKLVRPASVIRSRFLQRRRRAAAPSDEKRAACSLETAALSGISAARDFLDGEEGRRLVPEVIDVTTPTLSTPMSMEYLRWRYGAIPAIQYYAAWTESSNGRAVVFFRMSSRYGLRGLRVSEVLSSCHNGGGAIVRELIKDVVAAVRPDYLLSVTAARAQSPGAMRRLGFLPAPGTGRTLLARELGEGVPAGVDPFKIGSWTLPLGSLEFV